jgi:hypothetical protein
VSYLLLLGLLGETTAASVYSCTDPITDANQFKDAFIKAQKENEEIFKKSDETPAPAVEAPAAEETAEAA